MSADSTSAPEPPTAQVPGGPLKSQLKLTSDPRLLSVVRSMVSELAAVSGFDDQQCRCIALAVDEALSNVIRHAYKNRRDQEIELSCQANSDCLEFAFFDHGEPADLARICAQPLDGVALGGRGTHLIRHIMDEVCYERVFDGNRLSLKKHLSAAKDKA